MLRSPRAALAASLALLASMAMVGSAPPAGAAPAVRDVSRFACGPDLSSPFTDIAGTTHEASIECAVHYDLTGGTSATTYTPDGVVTRGQMATFIMRFLGVPDIQPGEFPSAGFTDTAGSPHEGSIDAVVDLGIAQGTSPTTFTPGGPVSRAQMATFLHRTLELVRYEPAAVGPDAFDDDDGNPHETAIQAIADAGIAGGTGPGVYQPSGTVSRGAMASFLVRVVDLGIEQSWYTPFVTSQSFAALAGSAEAPGPGDAEGKGTAFAMTTDVPGVLCVGLAVEGIGTPTAAQVHQGAAGAAGPIVIELPTPPAGGAVIRCVSDPDADAVGTDPGGFYVNVQTADFPDGAVRGQLGEIGVEFGAELTDVEVVPGPGDPNAFGAAQGFTTSQPDTVCTQVLLLADNPPSDAHLHQGPPHTNGPAVLTLDVIDFNDPNLFTEVILGLECQVTNMADQLAVDPSLFYVDIHTANFPDGAVRGQLEQFVGFTSTGTSAGVGGFSRSLHLGRG